MSEGASQSIEVKAAPLCCAFCFARSHEVERLIVGPALACVCNDCVELCADIIRESRDDRVRAGEAEYLSWGASA